MATAVPYGSVERFFAGAVPHEGVFEMTLLDVVELLFLALAVPYLPSVMGLGATAERRPSLGGASGPLLGLLVVTPASFWEGEAALPLRFPTEDGTAPVTAALLDFD